MRCFKRAFYALSSSIQFYQVVAASPPHIMRQPKLPIVLHKQKQTLPADGRKLPIPMTYKRHGTLLKAPGTVTHQANIVSGSIPMMNVNSKAAQPDPDQNYG